jgi:hypothetical protein
MLYAQKRQVVFRVQEPGKRREHQRHLFGANDSRKFVAFELTDEAEQNGKEKGEPMKSIPDATHRHKRLGAVVVLQMTSELAKIVMPVSGDEFWVKVSELSELTADAPPKAKATKKQSKAERPEASADSRYGTARVA